MHWAETSTAQVIIFHPITQFSTAECTQQLTWSNSYTNVSHFSAPSVTNSTPEGCCCRNDGTRAGIDVGHVRNQQPPASPTMRRAGILQHAHWLPHCVMQWYQRKSNQKLPDLHISHCRANQCLFCMDYGYLLWNSRHFLFIYFFVWAADSPSCRAKVAVLKAGRTRARTWEDVSVCFISNFVPPHVRDSMWKMSRSLNVWQKSPCGSSMWVFFECTC